MLEIVSPMISAERKHCHGIAPYPATFAPAAAVFRWHNGAYEHAVLPVCLINKRSGALALLPPNTMANGHSLGIVEFLAQARAILLWER